jgi:hypothetical protein
MLKAIRFVMLFAMAFAITSCVSIHFGSMHQAHNVVISKKLYVDAAFTQEECDLIQKSTDTIEYYTDHIIHYELVFGFDMNDDRNDDPNKYFDKIIIRKLNSHDQLTRYMDHTISKEVGREINIYGYDWKKKTYEYILVVVDRLRNRDGTINSKLFQSVVIHENMHAINLKHFDDGPSIMNTEFEAMAKVLSSTDLKPITCLTTNDTEQFCSLYFCKAEELPHC